MEDVFGVATGVVAAVASVVGAVATYVQARIAWRQSREGEASQALIMRCLRAQRSGRVSYRSQGNSRPG